MIGNIKGILFDLDGTLLDTAPDLAATANLLFTRHQRPEKPYTLLRPLAGDGIMSYLELGFGTSLTDNDIKVLKQEFIDIYLLKFGEKTCFFPDTEKLLALLAQKKISWGIVTNKPTRFSLLTVEKFSLLKQAKSLVSGDTLPKSKPHPEPIWLACDQIQCAPANCLFIGDHDRDIIAGRSAGTYTGVAKYGYIPYNADPELWGGNVLFSTVAQIYDYVTILGNA